MEHPGGVAPLEQFVGPGVVQIHVVDVDVDPVHLADQVQGVVDHREVPQTQEVHLEQTQLLHRVHLELGDGRGLVLRLGVRLALYGQVLREGFACDHDRGGVDGVLPTQPLQAPGDVDHLLDVGVGLVHLP